MATEESVVIFLVKVLMIYRVRHFLLYPFCITIYPIIFRNANQLFFICISILFLLYL